MDLTALQNRSAVRFQDAAFQIVTAQEWVDYINARYQQVVASHPDWPFKDQHICAPVASGARATTSALSGGSWKVRAVFDVTNDNVLVPITGSSTPNRIDPEDTWRGIPRWYRVYANKIEVYPRPTTAIELQVDGQVEVAVLACADEPIFPEQYHRMLIEGALADAYADDGNIEQYQLHEKLFQDRLAELEADLLGPQEEGYPQIVDNWYA